MTGRHATVARQRSPLRGELCVPGDKSLSHRAVLFAAMAEGTSELRGLLASADVQSSLGAVVALGASVEWEFGPDGRRSLARVRGWGASGPGTPSGPIDCGNSGTTARLLPGLIAGWPIEAVLVGDESLSRRPMRRITEPLSAMGATFETTAAGTLPMKVHGARLRHIDHESPVASAQVKTAVLLAGLRADGRTSVTEPALSRDHTERLLPAFGIEVGRDDEVPVCWVDGPAVPTACDVEVPGDISSAAFPLAAAALVADSEVVCTGVGLNPTRIGFVRVLARMGADVTVVLDRYEGAEPVGRVTVRGGAPLRATLVDADEVPSLVDEVPILAVLASQAEGTTRFEGVSELRVKESDRLLAIAEGLGRLGAAARFGEDWLEVDGPATLQGCELDALGDHRLAMSYAVAGLVAEGDTRVERFEAVEVSYPEFVRDMVGLGMQAPR